MFNTIGGKQPVLRSVDAAPQPVAVKVAGVAAKAPVAQTGFTPAAAAQTAPVGPVTARIELPTPNNIDEAFDSIPSTASGRAQVRRHTENVPAWHMKWEILTGATQTFDFSYFSIERDAYGFAYMGALLDAQLRGVQVRGITDYLANSRGHGFASTGLGADYAQELVEHGAKLAVYNDPSSRLSMIKHGMTYRPIAANHDKFSVADAGTPKVNSETGGRNSARSYHQTPHDNPESWNDVSIQIRGTPANGFKVALERELEGPAVTWVKKDVFNVKPRTAELLASFQLMERWIAGSPFTQAEKYALRGGDPSIRASMAKDLLHEAIDAMRAMPHAPASARSHEFSSGELKDLEARALELVNDLDLKGTRAAFKDSDGYVEAEVKLIDQVGVASTGDAAARTNEMAPALLQLIKGARHEIVIANPYVVLTEEMVQALEAAAKRGVKITIVTNSPESTDSAVTQAFFLNSWKTVLARVPDLKLFVALGERKFHGKAFVADGKVSGDTSYNADLLSGWINGEIGAVTRSKTIALDLLNAIANDLANPANEFVEWALERDADGTPVRDAKGELVVTRGPEHDVRPLLLKGYKVLQYLADAFTKTKPGAPLRIADAP